MPKPTQDDIYAAYADLFGTQLSIAPGTVAKRVSALWSEAWDRDRERLTMSVSFCPEMQEAIANAVTTDGGEEWLRADEDPEAYNERMRLCRHGYERALFANPNSIPASLVSRETAVRTLAAKAFPLRKRVPRVVEDPHRDDGEWSVSGGLLQWRPEGSSNWRGPMAGASITTERVMVLSDLLSNPHEWVEDTEPEIGDNFALGA